MAEGERGTNVRELESLRIARGSEPKRRSRAVTAIVVLIVLALAAGGGTKPGCIRWGARRKSKPRRSRSKAPDNPASC